MACRICLEDTGVLISPCACKGSTAYVHQTCLDTWVHTDSTPKTQCEICHHDYYSTESCSFQPSRYCTNCFKCYVKDTQAQLKYSCKIFGLSLCFLAWTPYDYYLIVSSIITISCALSFLLSVYMRPEMIHEHCNYVVTFKCAFSLALFLVLIVSYYVSETDCEYQCLLEEQICNSVCSKYNDMLSRTMLLDYTGMIDIVNLALVVTIRGLLLCTVYMRKTSYQNLMEDRERLLISDCNSSSSSSSLSASGEV